MNYKKIIYNDYNKLLVLGILKIYLYIKKTIFITHILNKLCKPNLNSIG